MKPNPLPYKTQENQLDEILNELVRNNLEDTNPSLLTNLDIPQAKQAILKSYIPIEEVDNRVTKILEKLSKELSIVIGHGTVSPTMYGAFIKKQLELEIEQLNSRRDRK
jgi:hypothetical protein